MNSEIILCKDINVDKNYVNTLSYNENQMVTLCRNKKIVSASDYSFIRNRNTISTGFKYEDVIKCNYMAFQNKDYSNKWFFAFIDDVQYIGNNNTEISYTIDAWSTWYSYWNRKPCYVVREHTNDDTIGKNTIPENLDIGDVICDKVQVLSPNDRYSITDPNGNNVTGDEFYYIVVASNHNPYTNESYSGVGLYGGIPTGVQWFAFDISMGSIYSTDISAVSDFVYRCAQNSKIEEIRSIFAVPSKAISSRSIDENHKIINGSITTWLEDITLNNFNSFSDFTPKNNKLYCYPYSYIRVTNNISNYNDYKFENFKNGITFDVKGNACEGFSCRLRPRYYDYIGNDSPTFHDDDKGLTLGKFPTFSWTGDSFTNWLTQNAVNFGVNKSLALIGGLIATGVGIATANPLATAGGIGSIAQSVASGIGAINDASFRAMDTNGNINTGDVSFIEGLLHYKFMHMRPKKEYLEVIDNYFTRFGYKTNRTKLANITGRQYFNYVEIGNSEIIGTGSVPSKYMEEINNAFRKGVTIWHDNDNIGNYNLNNVIV